MGNYREQYENYYGNMKRQGAAAYRRASSYEGSTFQKQNNKKNKDNILSKITRKFIWQLLASVILLLLISGFKVVSMQGVGVEVYEKSKEIIDKDFDVNTAVMYISVPEGGENYKERALDYIDEIKSYVSGERTLKEVVKEDYVKPVIGKVKYINGESKGIAISCDKEEEVVSAYGGIVEEVRDDDNKCVVINHGNGTETYYGSLSQVDVEEGDTITKGETIGKCGYIDSTDKKGVIFKFIYLGNEKNPSDVMNLSSLEDV